ncbi:MAG TPA: tyrosine-type recombinase/integrase [Aggregatilinea sp.]|uniref:tyrosine-type recombinase/integrase n=1 Tax=Aggregatilinea sp. TaxID=2806333 RepID=UPI002C112D6B|nr:tyrosine-type recombinase/integrase [Aggregatilinea sp.]HML21855.1 tyrosine-type recombinase/integrase [Aggregatilinea sp.]
MRKKKGEITIYNDWGSVLLEGITNKDAKSRLQRYQTYLHHNGIDWWSPDLALYRDHLRREGLSESSVKAHLATIRSRYRALIRQRDLFYGMLPPSGSMADTKAVVDELIMRIQNAIHPDEAPTRVIKKQDRTDRERMWLTADEAADLIAQPEHLYGDTPLAWRDSAILAMLLSTGVREFELSALNVSDLYHTVDGELCLLVREGKGGKQRVIPYGEALAGLHYTERFVQYLDDCGITGDPAVYWSFWKDNRSLRGRLSNRRIGEIVRSYSTIRDGMMITVAPHDLRRTYARLQYHAGLGLVALSQNMGHSSIDETKTYIGDMAIDERRSRRAF